MAMDRTNNEVNASELNRIGATIEIVPTNGIKVYVVKDSQLNELERGSQADLFLEFAISLLSIFASLFASLLLADCEGKVFTAFLSITVITFISGIILLLLWHRQRISKKTIIEEIRSNESINKEI